MKGREGFRVGVKGRRYQLGKVSSSAARQRNCELMKVEGRLHIVNQHFDLDHVCKLNIETFSSSCPSSRL